MAAPVVVVVVVVVVAAAADVSAVVGLPLPDANPSGRASESGRQPVAGSSAAGAGRILPEAVLQFSLSTLGTAPLRPLR